MLYLLHKPPVLLFLEVGEDPKGVPITKSDILQETFLCICKLAFDLISIFSHCLLKDAGMFGNSAN